MQNTKLKAIVKSNGINAGIEALKALSYKSKCLFLADLAEAVVHLAPCEAAGEAIEAIKLFAKNELTSAELATYENKAYIISGHVAHVAYCKNDNNDDNDDAAYAASDLAATPYIAAAHAANENNENAAVSAVNAVSDIIGMQAVSALFEKHFY